MLRCQPEGATFDASACWPLGCSLANVTIDEACEAKNYAKCIEYEAQALIYTLQGLVNRDAPRSAEPPLP